MSLRMPEVDAAVLARRARIAAALRTIVPGEGVIATEREMKPYETDGLTAYHQPPMVVVLPETTEQVSQVLRYCHDEGIKVVPRGAGTSLSGGALPLADGVLLGMAKFNRIRDIDFDNRAVVVEPGVTNLAVTNAVAACRLLLRARSVSQIACTIGGNVAENSGGVHCLKYGMTTNNVLGCEIVLMTGEILRLGGKHLDAERLRPARIDHRLGRPARRRHRSHRAHPEEAGDRARRAGRLPHVRGCRRMRARRSSAPASFRAAWK